MWRRPANDFVRDFLGTDLGLRVMQRHTLESVELAPVGADGTLAQIGSSATLREALALLVDLRAERLSVTRSGAAIGEVTFERLVRALGRES